MSHHRIVITGIGLTAPNGNTLEEYRANLLNNVSTIQNIETRYMGTVHAGVCDFDPLKYQTKKAVRIGTRAGSVGIYCANEAITDSGIDSDTLAAQLQSEKPAIEIPESYLDFSKKVSQKVHG